MESIEQEIQDKGLTAPRVTPADIEASIASEHYFTAADGLVNEIMTAAAGGGGTDERLDQIESAISALGLLTFCVLVLKNGFTVTGESACASPENFDAELGRKIARQNAVSKMWPLMGYALRTKLASQPEAPKAAPPDCPHAAPFRYCPECVADPCPCGLGKK